MSFPKNVESKINPSKTASNESPINDKQRSAGIRRVTNVMDFPSLHMSDLVKFGKGVYRIKDNGNYIVKILSNFVTTGEEEVECFNKVHGMNSARIIDIESSSKAIIMKYLNGKTIDKLTRHEIPENLMQKLIDCLSDLRGKGIYHEDLELHNFIYNKDTNKVSAIDITNALGKPNKLSEEQLNSYVCHFLGKVRDFCARKTGVAPIIPNSIFATDMT
ncbi:MAG: hypothetical protein ACRC24_00200 [Vibrionaceae bacterium]